MTTLALALIVALAFTVEGALGFGATVVTVTLGAFLLPIDVLLPAYVPVNVVLSATIVARARAHVDVRLLTRRIAPLMLLGMPLGMLAMRSVDGAVLVRVYGALIVLLAVLELSGKAPKPSRRAGHALLFAAGAVQGAFGTGGPLTVFVVGKELAAREDAKHVFRATLSALWLVLNVVLLAGFAWDGKLDAASARTSLWFAGALVVGLGAGELVHRTLPAARFKSAVWVMLAIAGAALLAR